MNLPRRIAAELLATAFLLCAVVGSGIMGERLAGGNTAIALLANTLATGAALVALILTFGPISGAHMNPAVTLSAAILDEPSGVKYPHTSAHKSSARMPVFDQPTRHGSSLPSFVARFRQRYCFVGYNRRNRDEQKATRTDSLYGQLGS
jgi:hypothetical protein